MVPVKKNVIPDYIVTTRLYRCYNPVTAKHLLVVGIVQKTQHRAAQQFNWQHHGPVGQRSFWMRESPGQKSGRWCRLPHEELPATIDVLRPLIDLDCLWPLRKSATRISPVELCCREMGSGGIVLNVQALDLKAF